MGKSGSGFGRALTSLGKIGTVGVGAAFTGLAATLKARIEDDDEELDDP